MKNVRINNSNRLKIIFVSIIISFFLPAKFIYSQSFTTVTSVNTSMTTSFKPQSKIWSYGGYWWVVMPLTAAQSSPDPAGVYLWRLDGTDFTKLMKLSDNYLTFADAKAIGSVTHILLLEGIADEESTPNAELVSIQFKDNSPSAPTYEPWTTRTSNVSITLDSGIDEAATIDIDSDGIMWLASDNGTEINVRWSDSDYSTWSLPITLNTGHAVDADDLCAVTAFGGNKIGVLWSNQAEQEFQFKYHVDGADPNTWTYEVAASGTNIADDHINFAVYSSGTTYNGTIYAAVKTSRDGQPSQALIGLLVRSKAGSWSFHTVQNGSGTRPIALLSETQNRIFVIWHGVGDGPIVYKSSPVDNISFPSSASTLDARFNFQDITSTKQSFTNEVLIMYNLDHADFGGPSWWYGTKADDSPFPVELSSFTANLLNDKVVLNWRTETEVNNYGFYIERSSFSPGTNWKTVGFVEGHGNSNSPKEYTYADENIFDSGKYYYRLKQIDNDGTSEYSDVVMINVGTPEKYYLSQNYPNPFNPTTVISWQLPISSIVTIKVYDMLGNEVATLENDEKEAGYYEINFDAKGLASGVYFYNISAGAYNSTKKMVLMK